MFGYYVRKINSKIKKEISHFLRQKIIKVKHEPTTIGQYCSKIKGVFSEIGSICEVLQHASQQCEQNVISIGIIDEDKNGVEKKGNRLDSSFMYTQLMKEILLTITFEQKHIDQFIQYCREAFADNTKQLTYINQLAHKYHEHTTIWWYTCHSFLYPKLNRGLRTMDADLMMKMGFFIGDLHRHIEQVHHEQFSGDTSRTGNRQGRLQEDGSQQGWTNIIQQFSLHRQESFNLSQLCSTCING